MARGVRYTTDDDLEGVTPSRLKRLGRDRQLEYMRSWFFAYHEDPVRETPISEGEYIFPWGGPYDAQDALQGEFGDFIDEGRISDLALDLERKGTLDWAPTSRHPDYGRDAPDMDEVDAALSVQSLPEAEMKVLNASEFRFGTAEEREARDSLQQEVSTLRRELSVLRNARAGIGHNNPPPDASADSVAEEPTPDSTEVVAAAIVDELTVPEPDVGKVVKAAVRLSKVKEYLIEKARLGADKGIEKGFENLFAWMPLGVAGMILTALLSLFWAVESALFRWVDVLTSLGKGFW